MNLAGKVDSITEFVMDVKVLETGAAVKVKDDTGIRIITIPDTSFSLLEQKAWKFDKQGRLLSESTSTWEDKRAELKEGIATLYTYKKGRINYVISRIDGGITDSAVYVYAGNHLSMVEVYDGKGKYKGRVQYFRNKEKVLTTISNKNSKLELLDMTKLRYDENLELVETSLHDNNQRIILTKKYETNTDSDGRKHVMIFEYAKPDTCTGMQSYLLDEMGNHLEDVTQDAKGNVSYISTAVFNENSHITEQTVFTREKLNIWNTYEYDSNRNWIMKRIYHNGKPYRFVRRTYVYRD